MVLPNNLSLAGMPMLGARKGSFSLCPLPWGAGGARIALSAKIFTSLLSCEGAFAGILDSFS